MTFSVRQFANEEEIVQIGRGFLALSLPKHLWTHEAHFSTTLYLLLRHPEIILERDMPGLIARYNESVGGVNSDTGGYHETLTQFFIRVVRHFAAASREDLLTTANALVGSPLASRDFPLQFYSKELLFSVRARRNWVEPDVRALDFI